MNQPAVDNEELDGVLTQLREARTLLSTPFGTSAPTASGASVGPDAVASESSNAAAKSDDLVAERTLQNAWAPFAVQALCAMFGEERTTTWLRFIRGNIGAAEVVFDLLRRAMSKPAQDPSKRSIK